MIGEEEKATVLDWIFFALIILAGGLLTLVTLFPTYLLLLTRW